VLRLEFAKLGDNKKINVHVPRRDGNNRDLEQRNRPGLLRMRTFHVER
jgi:hypothetical protein